MINSDKFRTWSTWLSGLLLAGLLGLAFFGLNRSLISKEFQDGWRFHTGQMVPARAIGQTFRSRLGGLARIDVRLGTYKRPLVRSVSLTLEEVENPVIHPRAWTMAAGDGGLPIEIHGNLQIGQTFIPQLEPLTGIWLVVDTRRLRPETKVRLRIWWDDLNEFPGPLLAESSLEAAHLTKNGFSLFPFQPLAGIRGAPLLMTVDLIDQTASDKLVVRLLSDAGDWFGLPRPHPYPFGEAYRPNVGWGKSFDVYRGVYGRKLPSHHWRGDLLFQPAYPPSEPRGRIVRKVERPGYLLSDNAYNRFSFEPLPDSKRKAYYFHLAVKEGLGVGPTTMADWVNRYPDGTLFLGGTPMEGSLSFRAYNLIDRAQAWNLVLERATRNKPGLLGEGGLIIGLLIGGLLALALMGGLLLGFRR